MIIIKNLQSNIEKYRNAENYYATIYQYQGNNLQIYTSYKKGNKSLSTVKSLNEDGTRTLINYTDDKISHLYFDVPGSKVAILDGNGVPGAVQIAEGLYTENVWQFIVRAIKSSIKRML